MRSFISSFFLLLSSLIINAQAPDYIQELKKLSEQEMKSNAAWLAPHSTRVVDNYDVKYHRCEWKINPNIYYITGEVTTYFEPKDAGFTEVDFDFATNMTVDSVKYH